jgi:hypothetical protein
LGGIVSLLVEEAGVSMELHHPKRLCGVEVELSAREAVGCRDLVVDNKCPRPSRFGNGIDLLAPRASMSSGASFASCSEVSEFTGQLMRMRGMTIFLS